MANAYLDFVKDFLQGMHNMSNCGIMFVFPTAKSSEGTCQAIGFFSFAHALR